MSLFRKWLESLSRTASPPSTIRFQCGQETDFEMPLSEALDIGEDPPGGTTCTAIFSDARTSKFTIQRNWNAGSNQKEGVQVERIVTAVVKATSEQTGLVLTQVLPMIQGLSTSYQEVLEEHKTMRTDMMAAHKLAADRSLESVIVTAQEKAAQAQKETINRALDIGERVATGLIESVAKKAVLQRMLMKLSKNTVEAIQKDVGENDFAELAGVLLGPAGGGPIQ